MTMIVVVIIGTILYFLPSIIADFRGGPVGSVVVINLFLGWTFLGWVVALALAMSSQRPAVVPAASSDKHDALKRCVACAEEIQRLAKICRFCGTDQEKKNSET